MAKLAVTEPMGQQAVEDQLLSALRQVSDHCNPPWLIESIFMRSLRSRDAGQRRVPLNTVGRAPLIVQRAVGRLAYGRPDVLHRMDLRIPPAVSHEILTIHDLAPLRFDDEGTLPRRVALGVQHASAVVTVSTFSAEEIGQEFGIPKPIVIPNGYDPDLLIHPPLNDVQLHALGITGPFVIHMGGSTTRKNLEGLASAWQDLARVETQIHLVLCGPPHPRRTALFSSLERCHMLGRVDRPTAVGLLKAASVAVVPSIYEGFGLPALEAMVVGTPLVASKRSSLPEVCGTDALLVEPDGESLAQGILNALHDEGIAAMVQRASSRARESTWKRAAHRYLEIYQQVAER